jgi:hypothetical protein
MLSLIPLEETLSNILRDILRSGDDVLGRTPESDFNFAFLHMLVSYARAKQESQGALARLRDAISVETQKPVSQIDELQIKARFVNLLQTRFKINPQKANDLFQVLQEDAE